MACILVCDDERNLRDLLCLALETAGHRPLSAATGREAMALLEREEAVELVITDLKLPDASGLDVLRHAKRLDPARPVLLITAYATTETAVTAMREGAYDYLEKPFRVENLKLLVARALEQGALRRENVELKQALRERGEAGLIGCGHAMTRVLEMVARVARTDATVLITGESGTGKELIARAIHGASSRSRGSFVAINCAAIPETLMESELFGHAKGAFSGAVASRKGVFEQADGGTLLLDEIGEMPIGTQAKLLRVLQERMVRPLGQSGEKSVDVRVLATTNRALEEEVASGGFREDLFYRLNVVRLEAPPLRRRREDIPLLVNHFIEQSARKHRLPVKGIDPAALDLLLDYAFPGNVRELENMIEGAVVLTGGDRVEVAVLPPQVRQGGGKGTEVVVAAVGESGVNLEDLLKNLEIRLIQQAMDQAGGIKTRAAELLGLSFRSLRYRLVKLGLRDEEEGG